MSEKKEPVEEIEIGPTLCEGGHTFFRRWVDGEVVQTGVGRLGGHPAEPGCIAFGPEGENGRRLVQRLPINAPGSTVHSGVNSAAYRDGWDRIFAARRAPSRAN